MQTQTQQGRAGGLALVSGLMVLLLLLVWSPVLHAHAALVDSKPASGTILMQAPQTASLRFNEPVAPLLLKLIRPDGTVETLTNVVTHEQRLELALPTLSAKGNYGLSWRVISADGHPVGGILTFSIGTPGTNLTSTPHSHPLRNGLIWLARFVAYVSLFTGIGGLVYQTLSPTPQGAFARHRHWLPVLLAVGAAALLLTLGLVGIDALDLPLSALLQPQPWTAGVSSSMGLAVLLGWMALIGAALSWKAVWTTAQPWLTVAALVLLGASLASSGHASTASPTWLSRPSVWLHGVALTLWVGSFLPLVCALRHDKPPHLLRWFSHWIPRILLVLTLSGVALIYVQFDQLASLWESRYGQVLIAKLVLVAFLLALGAYNRYRLSPAVMQKREGARYAQQRVIRLEYALAVLILAVVALWRFTPPPRSLAQWVAPGIASHIRTETGMADLVYLPATATSRPTLTITLHQPGFIPLQAQEVEVTFSNPQAGIASITFPAAPTLQGQWLVNPIELPHLASWNIRIQVLVSDFERINLDGTLNLQTH